MSNVLDALLESAGSIPEAVSTDLKPPLPKTKGEVNKLATEQMDALVEAHGLAMPGEWSEGSAAEKHKMLNVALGFVASKTKAKKGDIAQANVIGQTADKVFSIENAVAPNAENLAILTASDDDGPVDLTPKGGGKPVLMAKKETVYASGGEITDPLSKVAQEIEGLKDQVAIESEITTLLTSEGMNDFRLGGLMLKLLEVGTFPDNSTFKEYIAGRWGLKYRKARYLIELYNGLLKSGVPWETVAGIGWSKIITLLPVLTPENAEEWVEKAKQYNNDTLQKTVEATLKGDGSKNPSDANLENSKLKTLTFGVGPDQEELIKEALDHAMKVGQTEHKGVALELICTEYLGNTSGIAPKPKAKPAPQLVSDENPEGTYIQESVVKSMLMKAYEPKAIFQHFLDQAGGDIPTAMSLLFGGDAFDEVFQNKVTLNMDVAN